MPFLASRRTISCSKVRRPFSAANYNALLVQILTTEPRPPHELRPAIPASFEKVVLTAMSRARDKRYRNAAEMQRALVGRQIQRAGRAAR